jgi:hypothetical protein
MRGESHAQPKFVAGIASALRASDDRGGTRIFTVTGP